MNHEIRREEIQILANKHQSIVQQQVIVLRKIQALKYQPTTELKSRIDQLTQDEVDARAELDQAMVGWNFSVFVQPII